MNLKTCSLFIIPLLVLLSFKPKSQKDCDRIKIETEVTHTSGNADNGVINLNIQGVSGKYKIHLIGDSPGKNQLNLKVNQINNLSSGVYDIVLQDPEGCTKAIKVSIN